MLNKQTTMIVSVRAAINYVNEQDGIVELAIPVRQLTKQETDTLDALFPNFEKQVGELLAKEALLSAVK